MPQEHINAVQPYVSEQVWTMVQLQLLTAARSGELVAMRPCDIATPSFFYNFPAACQTPERGHFELLCGS